MIRLSHRDLLDRHHDGGGCTGQSRFACHGATLDPGRATWLELCPALEASTATIKGPIESNSQVSYANGNAIGASRAEVRRSVIATTVREESQVTPQGRHR